jgi:ElaB/YqjD/DUF883 family membrane-anchored ribosome-binding protein
LSSADQWNLHRIAAFLVGPLTKVSDHPRRLNMATATNYSNPNRDETARRASDRASDFAESANQQIDRALDSAEQVARQVAEQGREATERVGEVAGNIKGAVDKSVRDQPMATLAVAAAVGFVLGALWKS